MAGMHRLAVLFILQVTGAAFHELVTSAESKIRVAMVKIILVEPNHLRVATFVIAVASLAFQVGRILVPAVKAAFFAHIQVNQVVTVETQLFLSGIAQADMTFGAFRLEFGVSRNEFAWHEKLLDLGCECLFTNDCANQQ